MSCLDDGRVVLVIERRAAKVNQSYLGVLENFHFLLPLVPPTLLFAAIVLVIVTVVEEDVFRFQICMS